MSIPDFSSAEERTKWIIERADYFTIIKFGGVGRYERHEKKTLIQARTTARRLVAARGGKYMIYAVSGIYDTWVENVGDTTDGKSKTKTKDKNMGRNP